MEKNSDLKEIECVDCKSFPNSCGYWKSKHNKHTCKGFVSAEEMNLNETLYALNQMDMRGVWCNSQVINKAIQFLSELGLGSVRPSVYLHARKMENRLREKDKEKGKDGWHDGNLYYYLKKASECLKTILDMIKITIIGELFEPLRNDKIVEADIHRAIEKCYDGSNFLMMLADNFRDILLKRGIKTHGKKRS